MNQTVSFTRLDRATEEDLQLLGRHLAADHKGLADRVLAHLGALAGQACGLQVDRLEHSLQTATRAHRDGADEETVVCALLHDIGDGLAPDNHGAFASEIVRPFVSEETYNIVRYHPEFQGYFFFERMGADRNMRERHRGRPWFEAAHEFCEKWDMPAFDPAYDSAPLSFFEPMVRRLFDRPPTHNGVAIPLRETRAA